jgi:hypothetical protein
LGIQLCKLAIGISVYRDEAIVSDSSYRSIVEVTQDSIPDYTGKIVRELFLHDNGDYVRTTDIIEWVNMPPATARYILEGMVLLKIVKKQKSDGWGYWKLKPRIIGLMDKLGLYKTKKTDNRKRIRRVK